MSYHDTKRLKANESFISALPNEIILKIMSHLSESKDILSFGLAWEKAMGIIPLLRREIVATDEDVIQECLQSVEGKNVVSKLICCINKKESGDKPDLCLPREKTTDLDPTPQKKVKSRSDLKKHFRIL